MVTELPTDAHYNKATEKHRYESATQCYNTLVSAAAPAVPGVITHEGLIKGLLDQRHTALVHRTTVRQETSLQSSGHARQALQQWEQILVLVLQQVPLMYEWRHQQLNVLLLVEVVTNGVGQRTYNEWTQHK